MPYELQTLCRQNKRPAVEQNGLALEYVKHQYESICLAAVLQCGQSFRYAQYQTDEVCLAAVRHSYIYFKNVKNKHEDLCIRALKINIKVRHVITSKNMTQRIIEFLEDYDAVSDSDSDDKKSSIKKFIKI